MSSSIITISPEKHEDIKYIEHIELYGKFSNNEIIEFLQNEEMDTEPLQTRLYFNEVKLTSKLLDALIKYICKMNIHIIELKFQQSITSIEVTREQITKLFDCISKTNIECLEFDLWNTTFLCTNEPLQDSLKTIKCLSLQMSHDTMAYFLENQKGQENILKNLKNLSSLELECQNRVYEIILYDFNQLNTTITNYNKNLINITLINCLVKGDLDHPSTIIKLQISDENVLSMIKQEEVLIVDVEEDILN